MFGVDPRECGCAVVRPLKLVNLLLIILSCSNNPFYSHYKHAVHWCQREEGDWNQAGYLSDTHTHKHKHTRVSTGINTGGG